MQRLYVAAHLPEAHLVRGLYSTDMRSVNPFQQELDRLQTLLESAGVTSLERAATAQALRQLANRLSL